MTKIKNKRLLENILSVVPIAIIILFVGNTLVPISHYDMFVFLVCSVGLMIGRALFQRGADRAMLPMGEALGSTLSKSRKLSLFVLCGLAFGFILVFAEPDLLILAEQIISINKWLFILTVALSVSLFLTLGIMRIIFQVKIKYVLLVSYSILFILMFFVPKALLAICFDAGSVISGPLTVPFILAFGAGISAVRSSKSASEDSFGLIALISVSPIIFTMILSLFIEPSVAASYTVATVSVEQNFTAIFSEFGQALLSNLYEIFLILTPIVVVFLLFNFKLLKLPKSQLIKLSIGLLYTYLGMTLFLSAITVGYLPISSVIGYSLATSFEWILLPFCVFIGLTIVFVEPAIQILNKQVEEITQGVITKRHMVICFAISYAISLSLTVIRVIYNLPILYFIIPLYILILLFLLIIPNIFSVIAFDSGGIAVSSMSTGFLLPFVMGVCFALGQDIFMSAFGTVAIIATMPILVIEMLGLFYKFAGRKKVLEKRRYRRNIEIIEFDVGEVK